MNSPLVTKPIPDNILSLIRKNFNSYLPKSQNFFEFKLGNRKNNKNLNLTYINLEKICYAVGPGKAHDNTEVLFMEEKIPNQLDSEKPIDFSYKIFHQGEEKFLGFIENKTVSNTSESTLKKEVKTTCHQVWNNYLAPLKINKNNYFSDRGKENNFVISICVYSPETYLASPYHYNNYSNDTDSSVSQRMKKYGFVMLTIFINLNKINSAEGLEILFGNFFNKYSNNFCLVTPIVHSVQGYSQRDVYGSSNNMKVTTTLDQIYKLPIFNINPASKITNTRNLSNNKRQDELTIDIFKSLLINFKSYYDNKVSIEEIYYSLGSKSRELSFYIPQTIVIYDHVCESSDVNQKMSQVTHFITSNMSLIDGQHSSDSFTKIVKMLNEKDYLEIQLQVIAEEIFGKDSFDSSKYSKFKKFVCDYQIEVSIKGFSNESAAQLAAENQNNIKKQSSTEKTVNEERTKILKIGTVVNANPDCNFKLDVNKGIWNNTQFNLHNPIKIIPVDYLTNVAGVWSHPTDYIKNNTNKLLGKNNSPTNALTNNSFKNAINWFINLDKEMESLSQDVGVLIEGIKNQKNDEIELSLDELQKKFDNDAHKFFVKVDKFKANNLDKITPVLDFLNAFRLAFKESNWEDMLKRLIQTKDILDNTHAVYESRIIKAVLIYKKTYEFNESYKGTFLTEKKSDKFYFFFNLINLLLRLNHIKNPSINHVNYLENLTENEIDEGFKDLEKRIKKAQEYLIANNTTLLELKFAKKDMDDNLKNILFFKKMLKYSNEISKTPISCLEKRRFA